MLLVYRKSKKAHRKILNNKKNIKIKQTHVNTLTIYTRAA